MHDPHDIDRLTASYAYDLPPELIAHHPADVRDHARLMVVPKTGPYEHRHFSDIGEYLRPGDCLVLNDTRVIPARLFGVKANGTAKVELLLLRCLHDTTWRVLVRPGRRVRPGHRVIIEPGVLEATVDDVEPGGERIVTFTCDGDFMELVARYGHVPLPPYIHETLKDPERYQTVYARHPGSVAAPTAGLHFTPELLDTLQADGIAIARLTLHVGLGTFRTVDEPAITDHAMHTEAYVLDADAASTIERTRREGGRVIAVGTTSCRTLEAVAAEQETNLCRGRLAPASGETNLFIYPGYTFRLTDAMITNFHLSKSTLLMLVSALMGRTRMLDAYRVAIERRYRFYSFGDAMLLLPHEHGEGELP
ncbi:MAG: tRNA preQ1(34) S-adenosylmethionine ribosyltransferase-isomerase QueA [Saccharofermentanales bacterium]|jgi:S-adenosylmethionine:tRNA ribosyltransferase-isomerase